MGGTPTGGATTGGATTGGATTGGTTTGGVTTGGATTGGTQSGGAPSGGATTGGTPSGGNTTGGTTIAGAENGGASSGGAGGGDGGTATAGAAGAGGADAAGFDIRIPETRTVECDDGIDATFADADTLCTFSDGTVTGEIYVQASAVSCRMLNSAVPTYEGFAQIMIDGIVTPLSGARYDSGGGHNNDSFDFAYGNTTYRYYHSSFNVGWRRCQPMDCVQLIPSIGALPNEVLDDGCTCERTRPIVCSQIRADGTYAPLDVDRFAVCPYDTTCGG